jgi:DNA ligase (NAD+)
MANGSAAHCRAREAIARAIETHNYRYYVLDAADDQRRRIRQAVPRAAGARGRHADLRSADSPTQRVGAKASTAFAPVTHGAPMLSLNNAFTDADIENFDRRVRDGWVRGAA